MLSWMIRAGYGGGDHCICSRENITSVVILHSYGLQTQHIVDQAKGPFNACKPELVEIVKYRYLTLLISLVIY